MCKKSMLIVAAAIAALGLSSHAFAQSFNTSNGTGYELPSRYRNDGGRHAGIGTGHGALATMSVTTGVAASCSDQIADLRKAARLSRQPTPETVWRAQTYAQLMFSADLALAEAQDALGRNDECLLSARHAKEALQEQPAYAAKEN
jgi:hypothetical protein